ncbi:ribosomal-processing cysteine protease Prp [Leptonema illini]|uniref:Ribosomal processing cysteine protease Prp n=1 Tax=Leptonema illini DSM 21528 TaxID=929563 RepID=H2CBY1_9LEPT|nr:ribosomal-processing cysteine protease Prp [Leptonema illini]EHQ08653.1 protein of unknown function DUF464 [Leptonema illini DSM 21528]
MIEISLRSDSEGRLTELQATGHAGLAVKGNDILCAAVSALLENLAAGLSEVVKAAEVRRDGDELRILIRPEAATELLCGTTLLTLKRLQSQHPDRIRITIQPELS